VHGAEEVAGMLQLVACHLPQQLGAGRDAHHEQGEQHRDHSFCCHDVAFFANLAVFQRFVITFGDKNCAKSRIQAIAVDPQRLYLCISSPTQHSGEQCEYNY